jgi:hypothetical protein
MVKSMLCGKILLAVLRRVPLPRLVYVHIKHGVLALIRVVENLMSTCHCLLRAFGQCSSYVWVVMVCLGTPAHGQVSLFMKEYADFVGLAPWVMRNIFVFECPHLQPIMDKFPGLSEYPSSFVNVWM